MNNSVLCIFDLWRGHVRNLLLFQLYRRPDDYDISPEPTVGALTEHYVNTTIAL